MNKDDIVYITLLILSIPIGFIFRLKAFEHSPRLKAALSSLLGLVTVCIVCQYDILYSFVLVVSNAIIIKLIHPKFVFI